MASHAFRSVVQLCRLFELRPLLAMSGILSRWTSGSRLGSVGVYQWIGLREN